MSWTSPRTWIAGETPTAAMFNTNLRDNLNYLRSNAMNWIGTIESRTNAAYGDLATVGPAVTVTTDVQANIMFSAQMTDGNAAGVALMSFAISGATTRAGGDGQSTGFVVATVPVNTVLSYAGLVTGLTAGSNTFTAKYRSSGGTDGAYFGNRSMTVAPC